MFFFKDKKRDLLALRLDVRDPASAKALAFIVALLSILNVEIVLTCSDEKSIVLHWLKSLHASDNILHCFFFQQRTA